MKRVVREMRENPVAFIRYCLGLAVEPWQATKMRLIVAEGRRRRRFPIRIMDASEITESVVR